MNVSKRFIRLALVGAVMLATPSGAQAKDEAILPAPETLLCPPSSGDLDYGIFKVMESARFQTRDGGLTWRRNAEGPFHFRSLEKASKIRVNFRRYRTAEGTRLILDPWWETSTHQIKVQQADVLATFQGVLDKFAEIFPCEAPQ